MNIFERIGGDIDALRDAVTEILDGGTPGGGGGDGPDLSGNLPGLVATVDIDSIDEQGTFPGGVVWGLRDYTGVDFFPLYRLTLYGEGGLGMQVNNAGPQDAVNWSNVVAFYPGGGMAVLGPNGEFYPVALEKDALGKGNEPGIKVVTVKKEPGVFASPPNDGGLLFDKDADFEYPARIVRGNFDSIDVQFMTGPFDDDGQSTWTTVMRVDKYGFLAMNPTGNYASNTFASTDTLNGAIANIAGLFISQPSFDTDPYTGNGVRMVKAGVTANLPPGFEVGTITTASGVVSDSNGLVQVQHQSLDCAKTHRSWTRDQIYEYDYQGGIETNSGWSSWIETVKAGDF